MIDAQVKKRKERLLNKINSHFGNADALIESKFQNCYHLGRKFEQIFGSKSEVAEIMAKSCFYLKFDEKAIDYIDFLMESSVAKKPDEHLLKLLMIKAKCLKRLCREKEYCELYEKLKSQYAGVRGWKDSDSELQKFSLPSESDKKIHCETVWNLIKETKIKKDNDYFYILSLKFLRKWKTYVNFKDHIKDDNAMIEEDEKNFMEEENENLVPPCLSQEDILLPDEEYLPDSVDFSGNTVLKSDLIENKDFFIISELAADQLHKSFGGIRIKRTSYLASDLSPKVEINLKEINFFMIPDILKIEKQQRIYISKMKKVKNLIDKILRTLDLFFLPEDLKLNKLDSRLWKVSSEVNITDVKKSLGQVPKKLEGKLLLEDVLIEDAEIGENDYLILEVKFNEGWKFISPEGVNGKKANSHAEPSNSGGVSDEDKIRYFDLNVSLRYSSESRKGLTGLQNLGNTCFMNSGLQCLSNTYELTDYFIRNEFIRDINMVNPIGSKGYLVSAYSELIKEMWVGKNPYVSPWNLKKIIGKYANQFYGYSQQDSQELLSYLLDGLHEDLNKIKKKPVVETIDSTNKKDDEVAKLSWDNHLKRNNSVIVDLFHGQFKSTLVCPDCKKISVTFDPFNMVSLPIPNIEYQKIYFYFIFKDPQKQPCKLTMNLPTITTADEIITKIASILKMPESSLCMYLLKEHKIQEQVTGEKTVTYIQNHPGLPFVFELFPEAPGRKPDSDRMEISDETMKAEPIKPYDQQAKREEEKPGKIEEGAGPQSEHSEPAIKQEEGQNKQPDNKEIEQIKLEEEASKSSKYIPQSQESKKRLENPLLVKVMVLQESKAFYDSEKNISYNRLLYLENDLTFEELHHVIYLKFRHNIAGYVSKDNSKMNLEIDLRNQSYEVLAHEYKTLFCEEKESDMLYKVNVLNQNIQSNPKKACELCDKKGCKGCKLPCDRHRLLSTLINKITIDGKEMVLEVRFSKIVKIENLGLNKCQDYPTEDSNENKGGNSNSIHDCINLFTRPEKLEKENAWYCSTCKEHKQATKTMAYFKEPKFLILHLKRFRTTKVNSFYSSSSKKITSFVSFPLNGLDLTEYIKGNKENKKIVYDLFAVSNHYGGISGGHYTAYAKNKFDNKWYDFNDSRVGSASTNEIVSAAAYLLFYKIRE